MTGSVKFIELLEAYLAGNLAPGEYRELMRLIKSGDYDDLLKQRIDDSMFHDSSVANPDDGRAQEMLDRILNSEKQTAKLIPLMKPEKKIRRWYAAAAALLIVALAIWALMPRQNERGTGLSKNNQKTLQAVADS